MTRIGYVDPAELTDPEMREWLEDAVTRRRPGPGPETQSIRAHNKVVMRSFTMLVRTMREEGVLEPDLRELMRARIATSWQWMFQTGACHY